MAATSGAQLLPNKAITNLREHILPLTTVLTPNIPEARLLLQDAGIPVPDIESLSEIVTIAKLVQSLGPKYVLVKGGHLPLTKDNKISTQNADRATVVDVLHDGSTCTVMKTDYSPSKNTHGTGCSLACMSQNLPPLRPWSSNPNFRNYPQRPSPPISPSAKTLPKPSHAQSSMLKSASERVRISVTAAGLLIISILFLCWQRRWERLRFVRRFLMKGARDSVAKGCGIDGMGRSTVLC